MIDPDSNGNEYKEYFLELKAPGALGPKTLPHSRAKFLETWEPQILGTLGVCPRFELLYK